MVSRPGLVVEDLDATTVSGPAKLVAGELDPPRRGKIWSASALEEVVQIRMRQVRYSIAAGCERRHKCIRLLLDSHNTSTLNKLLDIAPRIDEIYCSIDDSSSRSAQIQYLVHYYSSLNSALSVDIVLIITCTDTLYQMYHINWPTPLI